MIEIVQNKMLVNQIEVIKEDDRNGNIVVINKHMELHEIDEEKERVEEMLLWMKSSRRLK